MTWNAHINNITSKAQKLLGFLRRNLQIKNEHTKDTLINVRKRRALG
jgi:hypothetical protein